MINFEWMTLSHLTNQVGVAAVEACHDGRVRIRRFETRSNDRRTRTTIQNHHIAAITHGNTAVAAISDSGMNLKIAHGSLPKQESTSRQVNELTAVELLR
jgi:hypothetical protein